MSGITDLETRLRAGVHSVGTTPADTQAAATQALRYRRVCAWINPGEAAGDPMSETVLYVPVAGTLRSAAVIPDADITAHAANYKTYKLTRDDGAGGGATDLTVGVNSKTGEGGTWTAGRAKSIGLHATLANRSWASAVAIKFVGTVSNLGVATSKCCVCIEYQED